MTKSGRGLALLLVTVACSLLLATRLLWCFMYLFTGAATTNVYVEPHDGTVNLRFTESESGIRAWGRKANNAIDNVEELELEPELELKSVIAFENEDVNEGKLLNGVDGEITLADSGEVDIWNDEKKMSEEMAKIDAKIDDENRELEDDPDKAIAYENSEDEATAGKIPEDGGTAGKNPEDEGTAGKRKLSDAVVYLERLAGDLAKTGSDVDNGPYHSRRIFESDYAEMKRSLRIFIYPHDQKDPFHHIFEPQNKVPSGNYASEEFFQQALMSSGMVTKDPSEANFFFLPVSITKARMDKRIDVAGLQKFCAKYVTGLRSEWSYWNRSNGADHFYLSCHSVARNAMDLVPIVKHNAIQLLCPASYFLKSYITHKDASVPQIWPRLGEEPKEVREIAQRTRLAFFAGALNSPVRQELQRTWTGDDKILIHKGRVPYPYSEALLSSKFCLHAKGYEVNTARLGDAMYYGCVPVVIANHYDLPFQDILDWSKFSIVVSSLDIPQLKKTLEEVTPEEYAELHSQVLKARKHFQWHAPPQEYDAFYTVMYELWKRRHIVKHV